MISALYFLTRGGEVIIEKQFREQIPRVILDNFWTSQIVPLTSGAAGGGDPMRDVPNVIQYGRFAFIHTLVNDVVLLAVVTTEVPPMTVLDILDLVVSVLDSYLKEVNDETLREQFSLVFQVLEELLDNGYPLTTEIAVLEELVPPPTIENRVRRLLDAPKKTKILDSQMVPWRSPGAQYTNNEILFDVVESMDVTVDSDGTVVRSELRGSIECSCKLSGMPDVAVRLAEADIFDDISMHRCIRLSRYEADRSFVFVPPDGRFTLLQYRCKPMLKAQPPLYVNPQISYNAEGGRINVIVGLRQGGVGLRPEEKNVQKLVVRIPLPSIVERVEFKGCSHGNPIFDADDKVVVWKIGALGSSTPSLSAEIFFRHDETGSTAAAGFGGIADAAASATAAGSAAPVAKKTRTFEGTGESVSIDFVVPDFIHSSVKVSSVEVMNEAYKVFKGVKYITRAGRFTIRTA